MLLILIVFGVGVLLSFVLFHIIQHQVTRDLDAKNSALIVLRKLDEIMMASLGLEDVAQRVTDAIAFELKFQIGVLALLDERLGMLKRVAMSRTPVGLKTHEYLPIPYTQISIPLTEGGNLLIQALKDGKMRITHSLYNVFRPVLNEETSKKIQTTIGIKTSLIFPVSAKGKRIGVMIISLDREENKISSYELEMMKKLMDAMGIALDNARVYGQLRETTQKLGQANQRLQELDKLKDDFVSVASHELRTPMTAIRAYSWMALNKPDIVLSEKMKKYLSRTLISTERLINLVNDMLNVSRIESGRIEIKPEAFNLIHLVSEVIEEVSVKASENNLKLVVLESKIPEVFADSEKVHQVLLNLVGNSLKFTPSGGQITISFFTDGKMVETSVKDTGAGISKEDLGQLFQKFGRLDSSYVAMGTSGGTGLGLFISKKLVELMHGRIWANSEGLNKGTTFSFSLPLEKYQVQPVTGEVKGLEPVAI